MCVLMFSSKQKSKAVKRFSHCCTAIFSSSTSTCVIVQSKSYTVKSNSVFLGPVNLSLLHCVSLIKQSLRSHLTCWAESILSWSISAEVLGRWNVDAMSQSMSDSATVKCNKTVTDQTAQPMNDLNTIWQHMLQIHTQWRVGLAGICCSMPHCHFWS